MSNRPFDFVEFCENFADRRKIYYACILIFYNMTTLQLQFNF